MGLGGARTAFALACVVALVATTAPAAFSSQGSSSTSLSGLDAGVFRQLNAIRVQNGLVALRESPELTAAAAQHSEEMALDGYFDHSSFDGTSFSARITHWYPVSGYASWSIGENLLWSSPSIGAVRAVNLWMSSPDHRRNILNAGWRQIGISAVHRSTATGTYRGRPVTIITADFGVRR